MLLFLQFSSCTILSEDIAYHGGKHMIQAITFLAYGPSFKKVCGKLLCVLFRFFEFTLLVIDRNEKFLWHLKFLSTQNYVVLEIAKWYSSITVVFERFFSTSAVLDILIELPEVPSDMTDRGDSEDVEVKQKQELLDPDKVKSEEFPPGFESENPRSDSQDVVNDAQLKTCTESGKLHVQSVVSYMYRVW